MSAGLEPITINLHGCARCHGEGHDGITFQPLTYPVEAEGCEDIDFTHWAPCPTNGEPILFGTIAIEDDPA